MGGDWGNYPQMVIFFRVGNLLYLIYPGTFTWPLDPECLTGWCCRKDFNIHPKTGIGDWLSCWFRRLRFVESFQRKSFMHCHIQIHMQIHYTSSRYIILDRYCRWRIDRYRMIQTYRHTDRHTHAHTHTHTIMHINAYHRGKTSESVGWVWPISGCTTWLLSIWRR